MKKKTNPNSMSVSSAWCNTPTFLCPKPNFEVLQGILFLSGCSMIRHLGQLLPFLYFLIFLWSKNYLGCSMKSLVISLMATYLSGIWALKLLSTSVVTLMYINKRFHQIYLPRSVWYNHLRSRYGVGSELTVKLNVH
jgi:hypothetical protein